MKNDEMIQETTNSAFSEWTFVPALRDIFAKFLFNLASMFYVDDSKRNLMAQKTYIPTIYKNSTVNDDLMYEKCKFTKNSGLNGSLLVSKVAKALIQPENFNFISNTTTNFSRIISMYEESAAVEESIKLSTSMSKIQEMSVGEPAVFVAEMETGASMSNSGDVGDFQELKCDKVIGITKRDTMNKIKMGKGRSASKREKKRQKCNERRSRLPAKNENEDSNRFIFDVNCIDNRTSQETVKKCKSKRRRRRKNTRNNCKSESGISEINNNVKEDEMRICSDVKCGLNLFVTNVTRVVWSFVDSDIECDDVSESDDEILFENSFVIGSTSPVIICSDDDGDDDWDEVSDIECGDNDLWNAFQTCGLQSFCLTSSFSTSISSDKSSNTTKNGVVVDKCNSDVDSRIQDANRRWQNGLKNDKTLNRRQDNEDRDKKVRFAPEKNIKNIHRMVTWASAYQLARKGHWEVYARDRARFQNRIKELEPILNPILTPSHRNAIYQRQFNCDGKN